MTTNENQGREPELVDDRTIEIMALAARALVIVIYAVVLATFVILSLGFLLHLAGASNQATFVEWTYRNTDRAMQPFRGMFPVERLDSRSTFDPSLLFAAAFYGFVAIGLHAIVNYLTGLARARHRKIALHDAAEAAAEIAIAERARVATSTAAPNTAAPNTAASDTGASKMFMAGTVDDDTRELRLPA